MRTILDLDYHDLCLSGNGDIPALNALFRDAKAAGFDTILWAPMVCGKAHYPSRVARPFTAADKMHRGSELVTALLGKFDPLQEAVRLGREFGLKILFYFRLFDDYYPGLECDYLQARPHLWWQSRCGAFAFQGWPCYHQPEVRDYKMRLFREQAAYGADGFLIEVGRSHSYFTTPHRAFDFFGFDEPVAAEFKRRHGIDIRDFKFSEPLVNAEGIYAGLPFVYSAEYEGAADFDREAWHWLKGESIDSFIRELRAAAPGRELLMQGGLCPPHPGALEDSVAKFYIDANQLATAGVIDGYSISQNFKPSSSAEIDAAFSPYFDGLRAASKPLGGWLNDILTADGGHGQFATLQSIENYLERAKNTSLDYFIIHEADFIVRHEQAAEVWRALCEFSS